MISDASGLFPVSPTRRKATLLRRCVLILLGIPFLLCACAQNSDSSLQDGYYTAEAANFDTHGWKEYVTIYVSGGRIITVEYNATNPSGFLKSWDMDYMRIMNAADGTYPNKYTREYADALLSRQDPAKVDVISGATHSYYSFQLLAQAAITQSLHASKTVAFVEVPIFEDEAPDLQPGM